MSIVNMGGITKAVEKLISENTTGYKVTRNKQRNEDPNIAAQGKGWIGIWRGDRSYEAHTTGSRPWLVNLSVMIEIQYASWANADDVEDRLMDAEKEIMDILNANRTLSSTVLMTTGYDVTDNKNESEEGVYFQASIITLKAQVRA